MSGRTGKVINIQAGLLTNGSSYRPRLPDKNISGVIAAFVPVYSDGPVPDSHGVPFSAPWERLKRFALINENVVILSSHFPLSDS
ncbi:hypothetical protein DSCW_15860 [Desulfosarcina widdelii]|uniref:Uncharacterized protein n=1 Tax=Desulfosarcina widdelii TaxID=947919 RepID=A0A5K7Z1Q1_9BACT|nr:hypothetical protein DSCW_15860 [Desulfosarcina widdelii]